jgi:predicted RNA binding protein YcfA (HicA-like mRNA interferase family)
MDGKSVIKTLQQHGFKCVRVKGSHHIMSNGKHVPFPVPVHGKRDLKVGTLKSIEKMSGVKLR